MPTKTEGTYLSDILVAEWDPRFNRSTAVAEGALVKGQIVKNGTAGLQKSPVVAAGTGANAVAITDAADASKVIILARGPAIVKRSFLTYGAGATTNQKNDTDLLLLAAGIKVITDEA